MYYILILFSTLLFSLQFYFNKIYQQHEGTGLHKTVIFSFGTSIVICFAMFLINGFEVGVTLFSLIVAVWYAINCILLTYCSVKALSSANLSIFSLFAMLGGMLLPFIGGVCFWGEPLTINKLLSCFLILSALVFGVGKPYHSKHALKYYIIVFICNGMAGVISKIHQSYTNINVSSPEFMFLGNLSVAVISGLILSYFRLTGKQLALARVKSSIACVSIYGSVNGIGNLLILISLIHVQASIQYPMITGGVMIISTVISFLMKENLNIRNVIAVLTAVAAVLLIV